LTDRQWRKKTERRKLHRMEHTGCHLGQIVDRTRRLSGREFRFCQRGMDEKALRRLVEAELAETDRSGL